MCYDLLDNLYFELNLSYHMKIVTFFAITIFLLLLAPSAAMGETKTFTVDAGTIQSFTIDLNAADRVDGSFSVGGGRGNDIDFHITGPAGEIIYPERRVQHGTDFQFTAHKDGAYTLFFSNGMSLISDKIVTLSFEVPKVNVGGCLIATATFGSELTPQVQQLREFRDNVLLKTNSGHAFMTSFNQIYYSFSPTIADWERENLVFKEVVKLAITPLLTSLSILNYVDIDSEEEMLGYGISLILLNIGMYLVVPFMITQKIRNKISK